MKTLQFTFLLLIYFCFCNIALSQSKPTAMKFDEFDDTSENQFYPTEEVDLSNRIERFIKQIKQERGIKVYLICYRARKTNGFDKYKSGNWASTTKAEINAKTKLGWEDVISIDGGYRERNTIEYWIVPKTAKPPAPTPSFDKSEVFECPKFTVYYIGYPFHKSKSIEFSVSDYNLDKIENLNFVWKVSSGTIVKGQGTKRIEVQLSDTDNKRVTAFVEIGGLPYPCEKVAFSTVDVGKKLYLVDSAERYNASELSARVDNFMMLLMNDLTLKGYIIVYANRNRGVQERERAISSVKRVFAFRNYDLNRVTIVRGGYREYDSVDIYVLAEGAILPKPTPTVDEKFIVLKRKRLKRR